MQQKSADVKNLQVTYTQGAPPNLFMKADSNKVSKRKMRETIEPLYNKFEDKNSWRLSRRQG